MQSSIHAPVALSLPLALPLRPAVSFTCSACEITEMRPDADLPAGWATETVGLTASAYCPDCAIDLPGGEIQ